MSEATQQATENQKVKSKKGVIVWGPQGSGKTEEAAKKIAAFYGLGNIVFDGMPGDKPIDNTLTISDFPLEGAKKFHDVMKAVNLCGLTANEAIDAGLLFLVRDGVVSTERPQALQPWQRSLAARCMQGYFAVKQKIAQCFHGKTSLFQSL